MTPKVCGTRHVLWKIKTLSDIKKISTNAARNVVDSDCLQVHCSQLKTTRTWGENITNSNRKAVYLWELLATASARTAVTLVMYNIDNNNRSNDFM